jgi:hypothetical protein
VDLVQVDGHQVKLQDLEDVVVVKVAVHPHAEQERRVQMVDLQLEELEAEVVVSTVPD